MKRPLFNLRIALALGALAATHAIAQVRGQFDINWHTVDCGGGLSTGGTLELIGTIGQPEAGPDLIGGVFSLVGGFWSRPVIIAPSCPPDVAPPQGDGLVNVNDLLAVINGWGACPQPCPPHCNPDITDDCSVNVNDLLAVINAWGTCP